MWVFVPLAALVVAVASQLVIPGVVYSPEHRPGYPLAPEDVVDTTQIAMGIDADFALLAPYYQLVRTYQPTFHGVAITPIAAQHSLQLYLGIDVDGADYEAQTDAVISALLTHPSTVSAVILGSDSVLRSSTASLIQQVRALRARVRAETRVGSLKIGTAQRLTDWLDPELSANMSALEAAVDVIGVNFFPFTEPGFTLEDPIALIDENWPLLQAQYPSSKLTITETGYPTSTATQAATYFNAFASSSYAPLGFYYTFFDRQKSDPNGDVVEFGLFTADGVSKGILPDLSTYQNESGAFASVIPGACYSPFHLDSYPLNGVAHGSLYTGMNNDFALMKKYVAVVRTYYSNYMGIDIAPIAAANGLPLFLGVFMTDQKWYDAQVSAAINGAVNHPSTVQAILVGNENVVPNGPYSASFISGQISYIRSKVLEQSNGKVRVPLGTVQRINEWLNPAIRSEMLALAANSDIIGVNIYPFFDNSYNGANPTALLNAQWNKMLALYPAAKLRLTETGFATGGAPSPISPRVVPSLANAINYYNGLLNWQPVAGGGEAFWYTFFDLRADDRTQPYALETYFGFFTAAGQQKAPGYPALYEPFVYPAFTPAVTTRAPTPAPVTAKPTPAPVVSTVAPGAPRLLRGANYDPFHNPSYPKDLNALGAAITADLQVVRKYFKIVRTVYANFYNINIAPYLAQAQLDVYLGIYMTRESWYASQVNSAVTAVVQYGAHVRAVLVGNENLNMNEAFSATEILVQVAAVKKQIAAAAQRSVPIGTVQTAQTWLGNVAGLPALAAAIDIIGVTYQPFLDGPYDPNNPMAGLSRTWAQLKAKYPAAKLRLVDVSFPSAVVPSGYNKVASLELEQAFYTALVQWTATNCPTSESFWGPFFDMPALGRTGGFYTSARAPKSTLFPYLL
ncbi:hypothetical protein ACHHYP_10299 [Achlya hypogyna]|uniref:glucan endo-1,3-beta-D-glucosidase n=1 Tax=Achlya hypogyna TaxID=1202772 RepID=A0A0A7CP89_ACHHY|nr:secreted protein [Achlya hypogyna]OQR86716.1 hypothetical protein ACHHYP_10299 [Achlya hypogyna]